MIYFITDGQNIKVGTARDLKNRLSQMKAGNPRPLSVLATCEGDHSLEQALHRVLSSSRVDGSLEWYSPSISILRLIARVRRDGVDAVHGRIAARHRHKRIGRGIAERAADQFSRDLSRFIGDLVAEKGTKTVADMIGVTEASVRLNRQGQVQFGALNLARLGVHEPDRVKALFEGRLYA